jgi:hypothetical protein
MISFVPLFSKTSNSFYVEHMSKISEGVPHFGAVCVDHNSDYHESFVLAKGKSYQDRFAILLMQGNVSPSFYVGNISDEKVFSEKGIATATTDNILQTVDGKLAVEYLLSIGLTKNDEGEIIGLNTFPLIIDYNDGTMPIALALLATTPEGYAVCADKIPEGSTLSVGSLTSDEVVKTFSRTLKKALSEKNDHHTMLMYSCVGRYFALGYNPLMELEQLQTQMKDTNITYMTSYAGGEICPVYGKKDKIINRNHGNSFIICAF